MNKLLLLLSIASLAFFLSCNDQQLSTIEPQAESAAKQFNLAGMDISLSGTDQENVVVSTEEILLDSVLAELIVLFPEKDPEMLRLVAQSHVDAMLGEPIYLSKYEVESLPEERDPEFGYLTMGNRSNTWYFILPHCICGHVVPEEKYGMDEGRKMYMCGCR